MIRVSGGMRKNDLRDILLHVNLCMNNKDFFV